MSSQKRDSSLRAVLLADPRNSQGEVRADKAGLCRDLHTLGAIHTMECPAPNDTGP